MGSRLVKFSFTPEENEQIEAVIRVPEEDRGVIHGVVKDHKNRSVKDAVVKLFEVLNNHEECRLKPITHTFTDEYGQFLFGPLTACKQYAIKVWINNVRIRELIIRPDDYNKSLDDNCRARGSSPKRSTIDSQQFAKTNYQSGYDDDLTGETEDEDV